MKKIFRTLHLWLSVPFGLIITLVCFSGATLVYEKELTEWCHPERYFVTSTGTAPLPLDELMEKVSASLPDSVRPTGLTISPDAGRTGQVSLSQPRRASVFVDPYTGDMKGRSERLPFFDVMFHLHRWLMGASSGEGILWGKLLVGTSTLLLVIILLTGLLMWLTNRHKPLAASLRISCTHGWTRFWHDLHVAGGIYATLFLLLIALTGLTWSFSWYRTGFYRLFGVESTAGSGMHGGQSSERSNNGRSNGQNDERSNGMHGERSGGRNGERNGERNDGMHGERGGSEGHRHSSYVRWQDVYDELVRRYPDYRQITLSNGTASVVPKGRNSLRATDKFEFHPRSGEITDFQPYDEQDKSGKVRSAVYMLHTGSWGGWLTRILTFLSALLGATLPLTGYYLWIRRLVVKKRHKKA